MKEPDRCLDVIKALVWRAFDLSRFSSPTVSSAVYPVILPFSNRSEIVSSVCNDVVFYLRVLETDVISDSVKNLDHIVHFAFIQIVGRQDVHFVSKVMVDSVDCWHRKVQFRKGHTTFGTVAAQSSRYKMRKHCTKAFGILIGGDKVDEFEVGDVAVVNVRPREHWAWNGGLHNISDCIVQKVRLVVNTLVSYRCLGRAVIEHDLKCKLLFSQAGQSIPKRFP